MRSATFSIFAISALLLSACLEATKPDAAPDVENGAVKFDLVEDSVNGLVVNAGGRRVAIKPPAGYCVENASVRKKQSVFFVMIDECEGVAPTPAITTVSLGDKALFRGGDPRAALDDLAAFLATEKGRMGVGLGGDAASIRILGTRRTDNVLYVLVEDNDAIAAKAFVGRFWRAFTELNGRAAIASLGVAGRTPMDDNDMLLQLSQIVDAMRRANGGAAQADIPDGPDDESLEG